MSIQNTLLSQTERWKQMFHGLTGAVENAKQAIQN